ncbi:uncharacterized protein LOC123670835 [Harmonia axyridis]|uniref:uncharacterized protein LOC123670835 n=1 Tax=Harmonia axyridis TaxID=115357 RepID=UPI001E2791E1|nr:uncharacterized protein LOC123670835 [Harmonia axyridis]
MTVKERLDYIIQSKRCHNCLGPHRTSSCLSKVTCFKCRKYHHTTLHISTTGSQSRKTNNKGDQSNWKTTAATFRPQQSTQSESTQFTTQRNISNNGQNSSNMQMVRNETIGTINGNNAYITTGNRESPKRQLHSVALLATAYVRVKSRNGALQTIRCLIDPGSEASFISTNAVQILKLQKHKNEAQIIGIGQSQSGSSQHMVFCELRPRFQSSFMINAALHVLPRISNSIPKEKIHNSLITEWNDIQFADPHFSNPGPIDMLLGVDIYKDIILDGVRRSSNGITAQNSEIGWLLYGNVKNISPSLQITSLTITINDEQSLSRFWELEEAADERRCSPEHELCERHYQSTHTRNRDGSYTVRLPFKSDAENLGLSKKQAVARLLQIERKFETNPSMEQNYKEFIREYIKLGHMKTAEAQPLNGIQVFLPHQCVIKADSTTTSTRVVFDGSAKTSTGYSLNDVLHSGPKIQQDLTDILFRWRKHRVALTADIEKMYRQIKIAEEDQPYHKIVWRFSKDEPIQEFQLTTSTYGTVPAAYLAIRTLHQLAEDEEKNFPRVAQIAKKDFYVDDLLTGADSVEVAEQL